MRKYNVNVSDNLCLVSIYSFEPMVLELLHSLLCLSYFLQFKLPIYIYIHIYFKHVKDINKNNQYILSLICELKKY